MCDFKGISDDDYEEEEEEETLQFGKSHFPNQLEFDNLVRDLNLRNAGRRNGELHEQDKKSEEVLFLFQTSS